MKILIIGSGSSGAIELYFLKHLKESLGENNVEILDVQGIFNNYYYSKLLNKVKFRLNLSYIYKHINKIILKEIEIFRPSIVWVFKGLEIFPKTLLILKKNNIKLINYNPDNPFIFSGRGSGNKNMINSMTLYDLYLTYDQSIKNDLINNHNINSELIPFGFEIDDNIRNECTNLSEINRVCFIGNPDKHRAKFILEISKEVPVSVYGKNWKKFLNNSSIHIHDSVIGLEFWKTLYKYRVQLNLMRIHNLNSHNMRTFEITGIGAIGLMPQTQDHQSFFEDQNEVFLFKSVTDCVKTAKKILALDQESTLKIRQAAKQRGAKSKYSYKDRTNLFIEIIKKVKILSN